MYRGEIVKIRTVFLWLDWPVRMGQELSDAVEIKYEVLMAIPRRVERGTVTGMTVKDSKEPNRNRNLNKGLLVKEYSRQTDGRTNGRTDGQTAGGLVDGQTHESLTK